MHNNCRTACVRATKGPLLAMGDDHAEMRAFYERYLQRCNEHRFSDLAEFVADDVAVNDSVTGRQGYGAGLQTVIETFPDFHWDLRRLLVDDCWLSARLVDTGTARSGRSISRSSRCTGSSTGGLPPCGAISTHLAWRSEPIGPRRRGNIGSDTSTSPPMMAARLGGLPGGGQQDCGTSAGRAAVTINDARAEVHVLDVSHRRDAPTCDP